MSLKRHIIAYMEQATNAVRAQTLEDVELGCEPRDLRVPRTWREFPEGYPCFSAFLVDDPDKTGTIFRRFDRTSARNLLYLENELSSLEVRLDSLEKECDLQTRVYVRDWTALNDAADKGEAKAVELLSLVINVREKVKEYHEALIRFNQVLSLTSPERRALKATRNVFANGASLRASPETMITDKLSEHLSEENERDLCALRKVPESDRLTRLFEGKLAFLFRVLHLDPLELRPLLAYTQEKINGQYVDYVRHQTVERVVSAISSILAAVFLIGAVLGLYFVQSQNARLGMLCGLTIAFAGSLALLTNARRQEVFAATAAYAAVLVVFLSDDFAQNAGTSTASPTARSVVTVTSTIFASATARA